MNIHIADKKKMKIAIAVFVASLAVFGCCILMDDDQSVEAAGNEAKIGTTEYPTLEDAYANANDGDTIELISNVVLDKVLVISKSITLAGKYTITANPSGTYDPNFNPVDGMIRPDGKYYAERSFLIHLIAPGSGHYEERNPAKLVVTLKDVTLDGAGKISAIWSHKAYLTMESGTIKNCYADTQPDSSGNPTGGNGAGLRSTNNSQFTMKGGSITGNKTEAKSLYQYAADCFFGSGNTVKLEGGQIGKIFCAAGIGGPYESKTTLNGCRVNEIFLAYQDVGAGKLCAAGLNYEDGNLRVLRLGTSTTGGSEFYEVSYPAKKKFMGGVEARIGKDVYLTLQEAYDAATPGAKIELLRDITLPEPLKITKSVSITGKNVNGGTENYTITPANADDKFINTDDRMAMIFIDNRPKDTNSPDSLTVTISDLTIDGKEKYRGITNRNATLIMESGKVTNCYSAGKTNYGSGVCITDKGKFVMKGGEIAGNKSDNTDDGYYEYTTDLWCGSETEATFDGGIVGKMRVQAKAVTDPNRPDWTVYSGGKATVNGGTFDAIHLDCAYDATHTPSAYNASLRYNGGDITKLMVSDISKKESGRNAVSQIDPLVIRTTYYGGTCTVEWYNTNVIHTDTLIQPHSTIEYTGPNPTKTSDTTAYRHIGWNTDASATVPLDLKTVEILEDTKFYAIFEESEAVAKIGTNLYSTLHDAYDAANVGDTITLLKDVTIDEPLIIKKSLTIEGDYTITGGPDASKFGKNSEEVMLGVVFVGISDGNTSHGATNDIKVTLRGLTLDGIGKYRVLTIWHSTAIIENVTIQNGYHETHGAGLHCTHGSSFTGRSSEITGNTVDIVDGYKEFGRDVFIGGGSSGRFTGCTVGSAFFNATDGHLARVTLDNDSSFDYVFLEATFNVGENGYKRAWVKIDSGSIGELWFAKSDRDNVEPRQSVSMQNPPAGKQYYGGANTVIWMNGTRTLETDVPVFYNEAPVYDGQTPEKSTAFATYNFIGWNTDEKATTVLDLSAEKIVDNTTYYAIFEVNEYVFTATLNGVTATYTTVTGATEPWDGGRLLIKKGESITIKFTTNDDKIVVTTNGAVETFDSNTATVTFVADNGYVFDVESLKSTDPPIETVKILASLTDVTATYSIGGDPAVSWTGTEFEVKKGSSVELVFTTTIDGRILIYDNGSVKEITGMTYTWRFAANEDHVLEVIAESGTTPSVDTVSITGKFSDVDVTYSVDSATPTAWNGAGFEVMKGATIDLMLTAAGDRIKCTDNGTMNLFDGTTAIYTFVADGNHLLEIKCMNNPTPAPTPTTIIITFDAQGGTATPSMVSVRAGGTISQLPTATYAGHSFAGWFTGSGSKVTTSTVFNASTTLYAHWVQPGDSIVITLDATGGTIGTSKVTAKSGSPVGDLPSPEKDGKKFVGWFTSAAGGDAVDSKTVFNIDTTIFAHWEDESEGGDNLMLYVAIIGIVVVLGLIFVLVRRH